MERTTTSDVNTRIAAENTFAQFLQGMESEKEKLTEDLENSKKTNLSLNQENVELKKQNANFQNDLKLAKKKKWCHICENETEMFVKQYAICSENCLKNLW